MKKAYTVPTFRGGIDVAVFSSSIPQPRAELAMDLIGRFGSVAGAPDGESSDGRAKVRLQTPDELVARCCAIADLAMNEFDKRGWMLALPEPTPPGPRKLSAEEI